MRFLVFCSLYCLFFKECGVVVDDRIPLPSVTEAYEGIVEWFSRPGAELARVVDVDEDGEEVVNCSYRGGGGARCAVGCLIPDELYSDEFEGKSIHAVGHRVWQYEDIYYNFHQTYQGKIDALPDVVRFLVRAQELHDNALSVEGFLGELGMLYSSFVRKVDGGEAE